MAQRQDDGLGLPELLQVLRPVASTFRASATADSPPLNERVTSSPPLERNE
jgi:hypothetical protein